MDHGRSEGKGEMEGQEGEGRGEKGREEGGGKEGKGMGGYPPPSENTGYGHVYQHHDPRGKHLQLSQ